MAKLKENMARILRGKFGDKSISMSERNWWKPLVEREQKAPATRPTRARTILGGDGETLGG